MQTIKQLITAASGYSANVKGLVLFVQDCDQGNSLTITLTDILGNQYTVKEVGPGAKIKPAGGFTNVQISTTADANVMFIVTSGDIDIQNSSTESTITNGDAQAVPVRTPAGTRLAVDIGGGTVDVTATNVSINNTADDPVPVTIVSEPGQPFQVTLVGSTDTAPLPVETVQAATVAENAPAVVGTAAGALLAAATRRAFRVRNAGTGLLAIGGNAALTLAQAALVLNPGDMWEETLVPSAAWYAISDTGTTAAVEVIA